MRCAMNAAANLAIADQVIEVSSEGIDQMLSVVHELLTDGRDRTRIIAIVMSSIVDLPIPGKENERALAIAIVRLAEAQREIQRLRGGAR